MDETSGELSARLTLGVSIKAWKLHFKASLYQVWDWRLLFTSRAALLLCVAFCAFCWFRTVIQLIVKLHSHSNRLALSSQDSQETRS